MFKRIVGVAAVLTVACGTTAGAVTYTPTLYTETGNCSVSDVTAATVSAKECFGSVLLEPVNDDNEFKENSLDKKANFNLDYFEDFGGDGIKQLSELGLFGKTDWSFIVKNDAPDADVGDKLTIGDGVFSYLGDLSSYGYVAVVLKQKDTFSAYLFDSIADFTSATWSTPSGQTAVDDLSHLSIYAGGVPAIPLPAAGWLLLAGLGGLAAYGRKKRWA